MDEKQPAECGSVRSKVYDRIQCEKICPRGRWYFLTHEYLLWGLWAVSILVGALAVSVTLFVISHHQYALYEATHDNQITFFVDVLPYVWIAIFALMAVIAVYNLRHTKCGYRYPISKILGSSMVLSLAGGSALQLFGFGYTVDHMLGTQMRMYISQEKMEERLWQNPEEGRLMGHVMVPNATTTTVLFTDARGEQWEVDVSELAPHERMLFRENEPVRIIGQILDEEMKQFHSCGAFPSLLDPSLTKRELHEARMAFVTKLESYKEQADKAISTIQADEVATSTVVATASPCGQIPPVRRYERAARGNAQPE